MQYNLSELLEEGRCARLPALVSAEPAYDTLAGITDVEVEIICSDDPQDSTLASQIKDMLVKERGTLMHISTVIGGLHITQILRFTFD